MSLNRREFIELMALAAAAAAATPKIFDFGAIAPHPDMDLDPLTMPIKYDWKNYSQIVTITNEHFIPKFADELFHPSIKKLTEKKMKLAQKNIREKLTRDLYSPEQNFLQKFFARL